MTTKSIKNVVESVVLLARQLWIEQERQPQSVGNPRDARRGFVTQLLAIGFALIVKKYRVFSHMRCTGFRALTRIYGKHSIEN